MGNGFLFSEENSRLAALLQGDPNDIHMNNRFGRIIAPGLMQLLGFVAMRSWVSGSSVEVHLDKPVVVPNPEAEYRKSYDNNFFLCDETKIYAKAKFQASEPIKLPNPLGHGYSYSLTKNPVNLSELKDWRNYNSVPFESVSSFIPETDYFTLRRVAAVGVAVNALAKSLGDNPGLLPDIFFSDVREKGSEAILEEKLKLYMGDYKNEEFQEFELRVHEPEYDSENKRKVTAIVSETNGLYIVQIHLVKFKVGSLSKLLGRA